MKYILTLLFCLSAGFYSSASSQINFEYDYCIFKNNDTSSFVEFYYSFLQNELIFVKNDQGYEMDGLISLRIVSNETGKEIFDQSFKTPLVVADTAAYNKNSSLMGQINLILKKGTYRLQIEARDFNDSLRRFSASDELVIENFPKGLSLSSLQLSSQITKSTNESDVFYKNSLEIIPNPSRIFGKNLSSVYYYIELYNLASPELTETFSVLKVIRDSDKNPVKSGKTEYKLTGSTRIEYGHFDISDLATGNYSFEVSLVDSKNSKLAEQSNKFWIYNTVDTNTAVISGNEKYELSEYKNYTEKQIQDEIEQISYIITDQFKSQLNNISDLEGKRVLLFNFWEKYDPNKSTTVNEFRVSYFDRIKYANKNYGSAFMVGWKTDRGRIYSLFGQPDDIERFPFESNQRAYEIWKYNQLEGGVEFVFIDLSGNGDNYQLVHSTKRNELRDDNWRNRLNIR